MQNLACVRAALETFLQLSPLNMAVKTKALEDKSNMIFINVFRVLRNRLDTRTNSARLNQ